MVRKLIILGIDGMDRDVIVRYKDKLPNLYGLMQKNNYPLPLYNSIRVRISSAPSYKSFIFVYSFVECA